MLVQAAVAGAIDFSTADVLSRDWWWKVRFILDQTEVNCQIDLLRLRLSMHLSVADYHTEPQQFNHHWDAANAITADIFTLQLPWLKDATSKPKPSGDKMVSAWKAKYGDPNDPAVQAKYDAVATYMRKARERIKELEVEKAKARKNKRTIRKRT